MRDRNAPLLSGNPAAFTWPFKSLFRYPHWLRRDWFGFFFDVGLRLTMRGGSFREVPTALAERTLRAVELGRNKWTVFGSESGGRTAARCTRWSARCKHLGIDPFAYLTDALPGLFALGEKPMAAQLLDWLPDRWLLRTRANTSRPASAACPPPAPPRDNLTDARCPGKPRTEPHHLPQRDSPDGYS